MATGLTNDPVHPGSWLGLPDFGITEWLQGQQPTVISPVSETAQTEQVAKDREAQQLRVEGQTTTKTAPTQTGGGGGGGGTRYQELAGIAAKGDLNPAQKTEYEALKKQIGEAAGSQEDAAKAAAEARRQAALRSYEGKKAAAGVAKESAKGQYDWIVETLGSNKKDLLDQVALNEKTGTEEYGRQEVKTNESYDKAKQEILTTYRDLQREQEKILRGTGVSSSSRSQEAQLRLNSLMGKDLSETSKSEADALAMIGNALSTFKEKVVMTKNSIETESKSKMDKAALDYDTQVKAIDANLQLSANEREDAYAAAEAQLAQDTSNIKSWAVGLQLQAAETMAKTKDSLDDFVVDMTDSQGLLGKDLSEKQAATQALVQQISTSVTLDKEGNLVTPTGGSKRSTSVKTLADLYAPEGASPTGEAGAIGQDTTKDPLLASMMA